MAHWLIKSEPAKYPWEQMVKDKRTHWDGVHNFQAALNMKAMKEGDRVFFYHSNEGKEIVGIVKVIKTYYPDDTDPSGKFGMCDFAAMKPLQTPVTLDAIKAEPKLKDMVLINNSRLSVQPVSEAEWTLICKMGGVS